MSRNKLPSSHITVEGLRIISINVNSIVALDRREHLLEFLVRQKPDIVLLNETHLNSWHSIIFKDFEFVRNDRVNCNGGGGTGILVRRPYRFHHIDKVEFKKFKWLEVSVIKLPLQGGDNLLVISAYAAGQNAREFGKELDSLFEILELNRLQNYYVLAGDLNARHST